MHDKVRKFIEDNITIIERNEWEELYEKAKYEFKYAYGLIGQLTSILMEIDFHPEYDLHELPRGFLFNSKVKSFTIPPNVQTIGTGAFEDCSELTDITIPDNITSIGKDAFNSCIKLETVKIEGNNLQRIQGNLFNGCKSLRFINIPSSIAYIHPSAFIGCKDLTISYSGTTSDWYSIFDYKAPVPYPYNAGFTVNCTDGQIVNKNR